MKGGGATMGVVGSSEGKKRDGTRRDGSARRPDDRSARGEEGWDEEGRVGQPSRWLGRRPNDRNARDEEGWGRLHSRCHELPTRGRTEVGLASAPEDGSGSARRWFPTKLNPGAWTDGGRLGVSSQLY